MKMIKKTLAALTLTAAAALPPGVSAEVLLTETFDYPAGNLYGKGNWVRSSHQMDPIQVTSTKLSHYSFIEGNAIKLGSTSTTAEDVAIACVPVASDSTVAPRTSGDIYAATLINVQNVTATKHFFSTVSTNYSMALSDGTSFTGDYNRVFTVPSDNPDKFKLGFGKSTTTPSETSGELDFNTTYLLVIHVGINEGSNNDIFEAWINPATDSKPAAQFAPTSGSDMSKGFVGMAVHQQTNFSSTCPDMLVGPIKVATTWEELFDGTGGGGGEDPDPDPTPGEGGEITVTVPDMQIALYQYQSYPVTVNVKAKELTSDITVGGLGSSIKASTTTISAADAMSADGYDLTLTLNPMTAIESITENVTLTAGTATATIPVNVPVYEASEMMNLRFAQTATAYQTYYFKNNVTVTHIDATNETMYVEDLVGGIALKYEYLYAEEPPYKVGDKINKFYMSCEEPVLGVPSFQIAPYFTPGGELGIANLVSSGNVTEPQEATLAAINTSPEDYINRLVKVSDLTFGEAGETFSTSSTPVTSGEATGNVRAFSGSDLIGVTIPETATVTAISTSMGAVVLTVRSAADVVAPEAEPGLTIEKELLIDTKEYYPIGEDTPFAKLTVKATNMAKPTALWFGGKQSSSFKADIEEIPAGTGEYTVNITFNPTQTGRNEATLNFDASPTELFQSISMACLAYDPQNMPAFSVDDSGLEPFSAAVGATQEQTVTISAQNLLDYGAVRVLGQGQGAFTISSISFLKQGDTTLKITFSPKAAGTFSETIEFSSPKAETVTITVSGSTSGSAPDEEKQGDELEFDTSAPLAKYATDFTGAGENNKPLSLDSWKNVALDGTRAFWAFIKEENTMAKVTAYDFNVTEDTPAEMLLLSPALDFKNCANRLLQFSIMGEFLTDDMTEEFNVLYIDPTLPENKRYQVISDIDVPTGADANGQWRPFVIDLEGQDLADTFFIGFHFKASRGHNSSATYYVDDFSWGSETTPFIRVDKTVATTTGTVGQTSKVADFTVTGLNLTEQIAIAFEGAHKTHFALSTTQLPAEGGQFSVDYSPTEKGDHAVYVVLTSAGAPATYIAVGGSATTSTIDSINAADKDSGTVYYNLRGQRIYRPTHGLYILNNRKVLIK